MKLTKKNIAVGATGALMALGMGAQALELRKYKALKKEAKTAKEISQAKRALDRSEEKHRAIVKMAQEIYNKHGKTMPEKIK